MNENNQMNNPDLTTGQPTQQQQPVNNQYAQPLSNNQYTQQPLNNQPPYQAPQQQYYQNPQQPNQNPPFYPNQQAPLYGPNLMQKADSRATLALVMGLIGIIAWLLPLFGYPITIIGIVSANMGMKSPTGKGKATAGLILSIIFLGLTMLNSLAGILLNS